MRTLLVVALFVVSSASFSGGQQDSSSAASPATDAQPARLKVYAVGPGVTAPELLPLGPPLAPAEKCKKKMDGKAVLSVIVDTAGQPHNIMFLRPLGTDLDKFALQIAAADRFKPGTRDGVPVVVGESLEVNIQACVEQVKNDTGKKTYILRLRSLPVQKLGTLPQSPEDAAFVSSDPNRKDFDNAAVSRIRAGSGITAPIVLNFPGAEFSDEARRAKYQGVCMLSMIVDAHGIPQNLRVIRKLDYGLSEKAIEAVNKYRFKPAMKDGRPVPVMIDVEVNFHLY
jgi:TonB family protein